MEKNMVDKLIRCTQCNELAAHPRDFGDFGWPSSLPGIEWSPEDVFMERAFFRLHGDHATEEIFVVPESIISDRPSYEPNKVLYFEASNGRERFLIRRTKKSLAQPAYYEVIPGRLQVSNISLHVQDKDLRKQLISHNGPFSLKEEMAQKFIQAFQEEVGTVPPEKISEEIETTEEGETPLLIYASLKESCWQKVLERCQKDLLQSDLQKIKYFIHQNKNPGDVLSLVIHREFSILAPELNRAG